MEQATVGDAGMGKDAGKKNQSGSIYLLIFVCPALNQQAY
jgi:hypothetical protein